MEVSQRDLPLYVSYVAHGCLKTGLTRKRIPESPTAKLQPSTTIQIKVAHELQDMIDMGLKRLPLPAQHHWLPQLLHSHIISPRIDERHLQKVAVSDVISIKRHTFAQDNRDDVKMLRIRSSSVFPIHRILAHRKAYSVIERYSESLTYPDDSFGA